MTPRTGPDYPQSAGGQCPVASHRKTTQGNDLDMSHSYWTANLRNSRTASTALGFNSADAAIRPIKKPAATWER